MYNLHKIWIENLVKLPIDKNSGAGIRQRAVDLSSVFLKKFAQKIALNLVRFYMFF